MSSDDFNDDYVDDDDNVDDVHLYNDDGNGEDQGQGQKNNKSKKSKTKSKTKTNVDDDDDDVENESNGNGKPTKAEIALDEVAPHCKKLFVDEYRVAHATIEVNEHMEIHPIDSSRFRRWARRLIYNETGIVIDSQTLKDAMAVLSAEAEFGSGKAIPLSLRVACELEAQSSNVNSIKSKWYYDLTNEKWEFIEITSEGWRIVNNLTLFHRFSNQLPQVYPSKEYPSDIFDRLIKLLLDVNVEEKNKENMDY